MQLILVAILSILFGIISDYAFYLFEIKWIKNITAPQYSPYSYLGMSFIMILRTAFILLMGYILSKYFLCGKEIYIVLCLFYIYRKIIEPINIRKRYVLSSKDDLSTAVQKAERELHFNHLNKIQGTNITVKDLVKDMIKREYEFAIATSMASMVGYVLFFYFPK